MGKTAGIVLAAGQGTRMRSATPKVLHEIAGRPLIRWALDAVRAGGAAPIFVVVAPGAEDVARVLPPDVTAVVQSKPLGTADAVRAGVEALKADAEVEDVVVAYGDHPLLTGEVFAALIRKRRETGAVMVMTVAPMENPTGYGRILRNGEGRVRAIVEEKVATPEERKIRDVNAGQYCFALDWLHGALGRVQPSPVGEYYLTDLLDLAVRDGKEVQSIEAPPYAEAGINDRAQLAAAAGVLRERINRRLMLGGVTLVDPATTYIDEDVEIGKDTIVYPGTTIHGLTIVGERCAIGPNSFIVASSIGSGTAVRMSVVEHARVDDDVQIGPFSHLRPGAQIEHDVVLGNYAEVKNSRLGAGTQMHHFSYLGDADVGENVNVGAGTITCNYNAETGVKSRTAVENGVALGSDTMLVAPVHVGQRALTGAGSVVTRDLPPNAVAVGVPARPVRERRDVSKRSDE